MKKPVKVNLSWDEKNKKWKVDFFIGKVKRIIREKKYKNAFFWKKYQNEVTLGFITNYKHNK